MTAETAAQAAARAVAPLLGKIAGDDLRAPAELQPGQMVKAAGEWFAVQRVTERGDLVLTAEDGSSMFYAVTAGERFAWHEGAF